MPAYIHGSLAVEQRTESAPVKANEQPKRAIYRSKGLPVQEKLLYLFTVVICVMVAGLIIWRYAQIYEMNTNIKEIEKKIKVLEAENMVLKTKVNDLSSNTRLQMEADKLGLGPADDKQIKTATTNPVKPSGAASGTASAAGTKKTKE